MLKLNEMVSDIPSLRALFVVAMPDGLLFDAWIGPGETWIADEAAPYFGDLVRANRAGLQSLKSWSTEMQVTIESKDVLLLLQQLNENYVMTLAFKRDAALGLARVYTKKLAERLTPVLPEPTAAARPLGVRVREFLEKYAPDPHAALRRVSLRTGIPFDTLKKPEMLSPEQASAFEETVKDLLGLDHLSV
jgi:predicted regulator of Ras-like GTPase activity (Roadblock/LC7/MglB family)